MKHWNTRNRDAFEPLHATGASQAAMMTIAPGESTSESSANEHAWAEQWLYVVQGEGEATSRKKKVALNKAAQKQEQWRIQRDKIARQVDRDLADLKKAMEAVKRAIQKREDMAKVLEKIAKKMDKTLKELKTIREVKVPEKLPQAPINSVDFAVLSAALMLMLAWWAAVRKLK